MKSEGRITGGAYAGQRYAFVREWLWPRWVVVILVDERGRGVYREVREQHLEV
jgi:hypothetical protein